MIIKALLTKLCHLLCSIFICILLTACNDDNVAPTATTQAVNVTAGNSVDIILAGTDRDGSIVSYQITSQPHNGSLLTGTGARRTYAPNTDFSGADALQFTVTDNAGAVSAPATVSININLPPTATAQSVLTSGSVDIILAGTDRDGSIVSYQITSQPHNGSLTGTGARRTYAPNAGFSGADALQFTVTDNYGAVSAPATVSININPVIEISIITFPEQGIQIAPISTEISWQLDTAWQGGINPLTFTLSTNHENVQIIGTTSGFAEISQRITTTVLANCGADRSNYMASINIQVSGTSTSGTSVDAHATIPLPVSCNDGNVAYASMEFYQGPQAWRRDFSTDSYTESTPSIVGRSAVIATSITHGSATVPLIVARLLDPFHEVIIERLEVLSTKTIAPSITTGNIWETKYVMKLPGNMNQPLNILAFSIDPDNSIIETNESDNDKLITLNGTRVPIFDIVFIPVQQAFIGKPTIDTQKYMETIYDFLPIVDNYRARVGNALIYRGRSFAIKSLLNEILALWNREAEPHEFYQGIFFYRTGAYCGLAFINGQVGVSGNIEACYGDVLAHEVGHNLSLTHTIGCGASGVDKRYPYAEARLGPNRGWRFSSGTFINPEDGYVDMMSYCKPRFISDYNFNKATLNFAGRTSFPTSLASNTLNTPKPITLYAPSSQTAAELSATVATKEPNPVAKAVATRQTEIPKSIAFTGSVESEEWQLKYVNLSYKSPRQPLEIGITRLE